MDASKIHLDEDIDHNLAKVKADAASSEEDSNSMSSDDTDFNPDELEAKSAKEEYDSDPSDTGAKRGHLVLAYLEFFSGAGDLFINPLPEKNKWCGAGFEGRGASRRPLSEYDNSRVLKIHQYHVSLVDAGLR